MNPEQIPDPQSSAPGEIRDHAIRPAGLMPKNAQAYLILGVAVIMVGAIAFSGGGKQAKANTTAIGPAVVDPNLGRIEEYRGRIDEQQRKLATEQARLEQTKRELGLLPGQNGPTQSQPSPAGGSAGAAQPSAEEQERAALEAEKRKREYQSLFASNIALSNRKDAEPKASAGPAPANVATRPPAFYPLPYPPPEASANGPTSSKQDSTQPRPAAERSSGPSEDPAREESQRERRPIDPSLQRADGKSYRLFEGAIIETVLTNRLDGTFNGPVNCMVTTDVYSHDLQHLLIPKGSRILGEVKRNNAFGQQRLAVFFHRVIMPDGYSASLDQFKGLSQIGGTGLRDQVNHHYAQVFGVSLAVGMIAGLANLNTGYGLNTSSSDAYRQGVSSSLSQSSLHILDRYLNILPTFTIREGHRIKIVLSDDLMVPAYDRHKVPSDL
jgi:type IV secretion system protein VirB10